MKKFWRTQIECTGNWPNKKIARLFVAGEPSGHDIVIDYDRLPENIISLLEKNKIFHAEYNFDGDFRNWEEK